MRYEFVQFVPCKSSLDEGVLYVSVEFATAIHLCACGCGNEVVTPLSPCDWCLVFDGRAVSLMPSIGNWRLECESHYWIRGGAVIWVAADCDRGRLTLSPPGRLRSSAWEKVVRWVKRWLRICVVR